jgi:hypothetical protein
MLDPVAFTVLAALASLWLLTAVVFLAVCKMAAIADRVEAPPAQSPRRPTTCPTVRSMILKSPQSDQLATYR